MVKKSSARKKSKSGVSKARKATRTKKRKSNTKQSKRSTSRKSRTSSISRLSATKKKKQSQQKSAHSRNAHGGVVVRIMGHGQYRLDYPIAAKLNEIDNEIIKIVQAAPHETGARADGLHQRFQKMLVEMTQLVTRKGRQVSRSEIIPSDLILPPEDISIDGARALFEGEGLMPN